MGRLNDWLQVLGLFGVLGGLVFVGLQLRQDRLISAADRLEASSADVKYWAELVLDHAELWTKGLSGEPLSESETAQFHVLATARELDYYTAWQNNLATPVSRNVGINELADSFVRQAAREFHSNPGLSSWWHAHNEEMKAVGRYGPRNQMVDEELRRLDAGEEE